MKTITHGSTLTASRGVALPTLTVLLAAGCAPVDEAEPQAAQPSVYGTDERQDVYAHPDGWMKALARQSTVALMRASMINTTSTSVTFNATTAGARYGLCSTEPLRNDPAAADCTGTLIDDDLVLTTGSCVENAAVCADTRFVFGYHRDAAGAMHPVTAGDVFRCSSLVARRVGTFNGRFYNYAIARLDRSATPRFTPVAFRRPTATLPVGRRLGTVTHDLGTPARIDAGGKVRDPRAASLDYFLATTDTAVGQGSGVWDLTNYEFVGLQSSDPQGLLRNGSCNTSSICAETGCTGTMVFHTRAILDDFCATNISPRLCTPPSPPANDDHAHAIRLTLGAGETTVTGTTQGATRDGPAVSCECTSGGNVWYSFSLLQPEVVYLDTAGSNLNTSLFLTDARGNLLAGQAGNPNPGLCNDNAGCTTGGFQWSAESRTAGVLGVGTYFVSVGACNPGNLYPGSFTLHLQHMPVRAASYLHPAQLSGDGAVSASLSGASVASSATCGGTASGEDARWFVSCGAQPQLFSLCRGDGGAFSRQVGSNTYNPVMYLRSGQTGAEVHCNDDGPSASNCTGTGGDALPYGARLANVTVPRGLNALFVDSRTGASGMTYTLRYTVR